MPNEKGSDIMFLLETNKEEIVSACTPSMIVWALVEWAAAEGHQIIAVDDEGDDLMLLVPFNDKRVFINKTKLISSGASIVCTEPFLMNKQRVVAILINVK